MKNYSDRLKTFFAQIRPSFTCTYLALLFSVNKWKSILVKKTCCLQNKNVGYWLHTMHYSNILVFVASTEEKKSIKGIWTISIWQLHKDPYQNFLSGHRIDDRFCSARFEIHIQTVFYTKLFLFFFSFKIVCQLLARHLSKEIKTMENYSDRLKPFFAQIRPSFTCTYLALVFSANKWKSILVKKLAARKKRMMAISYIPCITQIYQFSWRRQKKKKSIKCLWTISIWQILKDHFQKNLSGQRIDDRFSYARLEIYIQTVFYRTVFFYLKIVCQLLACRLSKEIKTMKNYSDRLKPFFAQIRPSFTCTYLALVFSANKWKSILVKKLAARKKRMMDISYIPCITQIYQFSWRRQKKKKSIKCLWTISIWRILKDHFQKNLSGHRIDDRFSYARLEIYIQTVFYRPFFFYLNIVCQLLACRLSKEIKTMKNYSDRLKTFFAQIRPSFTCTYLALLFSVNKWKSILVKKTCCLQNKNVGYWLHTMHYSYILVFVASTEEKKIN